MKNSGEKKSRNFKTLKYGSATALMIVIFAGILIFVNIFAGYLTERFSLKKDMTEEKLFSMSDEAKEALAEVSEDVDIYILAKESSVANNDVLTNAVELIGLYNTETGGKISYEFLDRHTNQEFYNEHPEARSVEDVAIVVKSAKRYLVLDTYDFYDYAQVYDKNSGSYTTLTNKKRYRTEELLVSSILHVTSDKVSNGGFVTSHNEDSVSMLQGIFEDNRFSINKSVDLTKEVPEDIKNLVIASPKVDFSAIEITNLDKYLSKSDNNLYIFIDGYSTALPNLERYLSEWGLSFAYEAVYDMEKSIYNIEAAKQGAGNSQIDGTHVIVTVPKNDAVDNADQGKLTLLAPYMRPVVSLWKEKSYNRTFSILETFDSAMGVTVTNVDGSYQQAISSYGPFAAGTIAERANGKNGMDGVSRIVAFGSTLLADEEYLSAVPNAYNRNFLTKVVKYANPDTNLFEVEAKIYVADDLNVYRDDINLIYWILVVIMPVAILASGIVIFVRRRRR